MNKKQTIQLSLYAMGLATMMICFIMLSYHITPFGQKLFFPGDLASQYMPFTSLLNEPSEWIYSFHNGLGSNMLSLISYYLTSPFNLLFFFVDDAHLLTATSLLIAFKLVLASGAMSYYLTTQKNLTMLANPVISLCYSFCGFTVIYFYNTLWLDVMIGLPLVVAGLERFIDHGKIGLYQVSLFFLLLSNYYMAWMVCLFLGMYFFYYLWKKKETTWKTLLQHRHLFYRFLLYSIVLVMMIGIIYVPTIVSMLNTGKGNMHLKDLIEPLFQTGFFGWSGFGVGTSHFNLRLDHQPLFYFGLLPLALSLVSLLKKHQRRFVDILFVSFLLLCVSLTPLTMVFQLFQKTAGFPFRFTYLITFILLALCAEGIVQQRITKATCQQALFGLCSFFILLYGFTKINLKIMHPLDKDSLLLSTVLCFAWGMILCLKNTRYHRLLWASLLMIELYGQTVMTLRYTPTVNIADIQKYTKQYEHALPKETKTLTRIDNTNINEMDYHLDLTGYNNGIWFGYSGTSAYTSTLNKENLTLAHMLGLYSWNERRISYFGATPLVDALLGVNQELIKTSDGIKAKTLHHTSTAYVLREPLQLHSDAFIQNQNKIANALFNKNVFTRTTIIQKKTTKTAATLTIQAKQNGTLYLQLPAVKLSHDDQYHIFKNGKEVTLPMELKNTALVPLGWMNKGETATISIRSRKHQSFQMLDCATFNDDFSTKANSNKITLAPLKAMTSLTTNDKANALLAIPYDASWQATVNGRKVMTKCSPLGLIELPLQKGKNDIELHYVPKTLYIGAVVSIVGVIIEAIIIFIYFRKAKHRA